MQARARIQSLIIKKSDCWSPGGISVSFSYFCENCVDAILLIFWVVLSSLSTTVCCFSPSWLFRVFKDKWPDHNGMCLWFFWVIVSLVGWFLVGYFFFIFRPFKGHFYCCSDMIFMLLSNIRKTLVVSKLCLVMSIWWMFFILNTKWKSRRTFQPVTSAVCAKCNFELYVHSKHSKTFRKHSLSTIYVSMFFYIVNIHTHKRRDLVKFGLSSS